MTSAASAMQSARTALVLDEPFWGHLALRLDIKADPTCKTAWVDGVTLGYNPAYIDTLVHDEVVALLAHEVGHCALGHPWRRSGREPKRWNMGCDYALNPILEDAGFRLPPNVLLDGQFRGKSAEWVCDRLPSEDEGPPETEGTSGDDGDDGDDGQDAPGAGDDDTDDDGQDDGQGAPGDDGDDGDGDGQDDGTGDGSGTSDDGQDDGTGDGSGTSDDGQDDGTGDGSGTSDDGDDDGTGDGSGTSDLGGDQGDLRDAPADAKEKEATEADWQRAVQEAANAAKSRGQLSGALARFAEEVGRPVVNWRAVLRRFCQDVSAADYSWARPNRRYVGLGLYLPSMHAEGMGPVVFGVDTSMSIGDVTLAQFASEVQAVIDEVRPRRVHVMYCDARVQRIDTFESGEALVVDSMPGGGGTDFRPVFDEVDKLEETPAAIIYLTDLYGSFPAQEHEVPTLWASINREKAPWGETVEIDC